jgi:nitrite reductase/ring-hydroxylating ferredoxin subunit
VPPASAAGADPDPYVQVTTVDAVAPGTVVRAEVEGTALAVANVDGSLCAVQDTCPHAGASLGRGSLDGWTLECPLHGGAFDVRSGEVVSGPADEGVRCYPVRTERGVVKVALGGGVSLATVDG